MERPSNNRKLSEAQVNLISSFRYLHSEKKITEINSLINFYLESKLDSAIEKVESDKNYSAEIYEEWLVAGKGVK